MNRTFRTKALGALLVLACAGRGGLPDAAAQEAEKAREYQLRDVVVTATKTEREILDVPSSISVVALSTVHES